MIFARTTPDVPPGKGISVFYVPRQTTGLTVGPRDKKMGQAGAWTADVYLDGARVPGEALIGGTPGTGYATAMRCLAHGRLHIAALCVGLAQRLVDESVAWAVSRRQGGRPIAGHQLVQAMLADSQTDLMAGRGLVLEAARAFDAGEDTKMGPACAKYFCSADGRPGRRPRRADPRRGGLHARRARRAASTGTHGCSASTRGPARSSSSSSPANSLAAVSSRLNIWPPRRRGAGTPETGGN